MRFTIILTSILLFSAIANARLENFTGEAREDGKLVYIEKHTVTYDDKNSVVSAKTVYVDPDGKNLGTLDSNFKKSLSLPEHIFEDGRTKGEYGIRRDGEKIILFNKDEGKTEQTKVLTEEKDSSRLLVGCQGFNYYLKDNLEELKKSKTQPVLFLIPGDLSSYRFTLNYLKENPDKTLEFEVKIESWWLRAFAPRLEFRYDPSIGRIVWYKGVSNLKNAAGKTMNVTIDYKY